MNPPQWWTLAGRYAPVCLRTPDCPGFFTKHAVVFVMPDIELNLGTYSFLSWQPPHYIISTIINIRSSFIFQITHLFHSNIQS